MHTIKLPIGKTLSSAWAYHKNFKRNFWIAYILLGLFLTAVVSIIFLFAIMGLLRAKKIVSV